MNRLKPSGLFALALAGLLALGACDASEQNIQWEPGNSLSLLGPFRASSATALEQGGARGVYTPVYPNDLSRNDVNFIVTNFNSARTYTWTFNGQPMTLNRAGEVGITNIPAETAPGPYTVRVVNNDGVAGEMIINVRRPALTVQLGFEGVAPRFAVWGTLATVIARASVGVPISTDPTVGFTPDERCQLAGSNILNTPACATAAAAGPLTVLAPTNAAFLAALDANNDGQLQNAEIPNAATLATILRRHIIPGTLRAAAITDGQTATTLAGTQVTFRRTGNQITVQLAGGNTATLTAPSDILSSNGVIHGINAVLRTQP